MDVKNNDYCRESFKNIYEAWRGGMYCDVNLVCGNKTIKAHRLVLASTSDYFKSMFKYTPIIENLETAEYVMDNSLLTEQSMELIVQYSYTGRIMIENHNVQELAIAANFLQIEFITVECQHFIAKNIDVNDINALVQFANRFNFRILLDGICSSLSKHFYNIREDAFVGLSVDELRSVISNKNFTVFKHGIPVTDPEIEILKLITEYCNLNDDKNTKKSVQDLLACVNFSDIIDKEEVKSLVSSNIILDCPFMHDILQHSFTSPTKVCTRTYSTSMKQLKIGKCFGPYIYHNTSPYNKDIHVTDSKTNINERLKTLKMLFKQVGGSLQLIGITILYRSGHSTKHGCDQAMLETEHELTLEENEVIVKVLVRSGSAIFSLKFWTNFGREFGPFGSEFGGENTESLCSGVTGYVHSLEFSLNTSSLHVFGLQFLWVTYSTETKTKVRDLFADDFYDEDDIYS